MSKFTVLGNVHCVVPENIYTTMVGISREAPYWNFHFLTQTYNHVIPPTAQEFPQVLCTPKKKKKKIV